MKNEEKARIDSFIYKENGKTFTYHRNIERTFT